MYEAFYGLSADPFRLSPDHRFCFYHPSYKKARAYMRYSLTRAEGFVMITGRPGTGKTTLINDLLSSVDTTKVSVARLATTQLQGEDFLRAVGYAFGIDSQGLDQATLLRDIERFLISLHQAGRSALLVVDEAQDLRPSALTELRLLANIQRGSELLMQAFLIGQEQLVPLIGRSEMEQFRQRIIAACHLQPLTVAEVRSYIEHRINCADWKGDPSIEGRVFHHIHRFSQGIPRQVNMFCSRLFLHGCVEEIHRITAEDALSVIEELKRERLAPDALLEAEPFERPVAPSDSPPREGGPGRRKARLIDAVNLRESSGGSVRDRTTAAPAGQVSVTLTPVARTMSGRTGFAAAYEAEEIVVDPLILPAVSHLQEPHGLDDLDLSTDLDAAPVSVPAASEQEALELPDIDVPLPHLQSEEQFGSGAATIDSFGPHLDDTASSRDVPTLPLLAERCSPVAASGGSSPRANNGRRSVLLGVCATVLLVASAYAYKHGHLETGTNWAVTWFEQARLPGGVFGPAVEDPRQHRPGGRP